MQGTAANNRQLQIPQLILKNIYLSNTQQNKTPIVSIHTKQVQSQMQVREQSETRNAHVRQHHQNVLNGSNSNQQQQPKTNEVRPLPQRSPLISKTKSSGHMGLTQQQQFNSFIMSGGVSGLNSMSSKISNKRKHASPNQRYQNIEMSDVEMLELFAENSQISMKKQKYGNEDNSFFLNNASDLAHDVRDMVPVRLGSAVKTNSHKRNNKYSTSKNKLQEKSKTLRSNNLLSDRSKSLIKVTVQKITKKQSDSPNQLTDVIKKKKNFEQSSGSWAFSVYLRIRPHKQNNQNVQMNVRGQNNQILQIIDPHDRILGHYITNQATPDREGEHSFLFDAIFEESQNNLDLFQEILQPLIPQLLDGYNVTCFAYGQTGSGKTHTMLGNFAQNKNNIEEQENQDNESDEKKFDRLKNLGISNLSIQNLFYQMYERQDKTNYQVRVSYLEIYNEQVRDLLADLGDQSDTQYSSRRTSNISSFEVQSNTNINQISLKKQVKMLLNQFKNENKQTITSPNAKNSDKFQKNLKIIEDPTRGVIVQDAQEIPVQEASELMDLVQLGNMRRFVANTGANKFSSRSHALLIFNIEGKQQIIKTSSEPQFNKEFKIIRSKLQIIDLAGSERASNTQNRGQRLIEGGNINKSLMALGQCINILAEQSKKGLGKNVSPRARSKNPSQIHAHKRPSQSLLDGISSGPSSPRSFLKKPHIPYRDSKLTRLLKDSLGGSTKTVMIACISQLASCYEETMNTIKYAQQAKSIENKKVKNEIILQEYNREEEMRRREAMRLAELAEKERIHTERMLQIAQQEAINISIKEAAQQEQLEKDKAPTSRQELQLPNSFKRDIEQIKVINLNKLENRLNTQRINSTGLNNRTHLMNLLTQKLIPNIVNQYNIRHQMQSNQILIDFQKQNVESQSARTNNQEIMKQMHSLKNDLDGIQTNQVNIQTEIMDMYDKQPQMTNFPEKDNLEEELLKTNLKKQNVEISILKEQVGKYEKLLCDTELKFNEYVYEQQQKGSDQITISDLKNEFQKEIQRLEIIIEDKNVEIDLIKSKQQQEIENNNEQMCYVMEQNKNMQEHIDNLEKKLAMQLHKIHKKDQQIESLKQSQNEVLNDKVLMNTFDSEKKESKTKKIVSANLSKYTTKSKDQSKDATTLKKTHQNQSSITYKLEAILDNSRNIINREHNSTQQSFKDSNISGNQYRKIKTLKRYLSGARVGDQPDKQSTQILDDERNNDNSRQQVIVKDKRSSEKKSNQNKSNEMRSPKDYRSPREKPSKQNTNRIMSLDFATKGNNSNSSNQQYENEQFQRLNTLPDPEDDLEFEQQNIENILRNAQTSTFAVGPRNAKKQHGTLDQQIMSDRSDFLQQFPKLRQSANNRKFQKNLQPRFSRSRSRGNHLNSRSRSNISQNDIVFKRCKTNQQLSGEASMNEYSKKNQMGKNLKTNPNGSFMIPNATEINIRKPSKQSLEMNHNSQQPYDLASMEDSFTFQNDITERPMDMMLSHYQLRNSQTRQNPFQSPLPSQIMGMDQRKPQQIQRDINLGSVIKKPGEFQTIDSESVPQILSIDRLIEPDHMILSTKKTAMINEISQRKIMESPNPYENGKSLYQIQTNRTDGENKQKSRNQADILGASTSSAVMEFNTQGIPQVQGPRINNQQHQLNDYGGCPGGGMTITSLDDQIIEEEYQQEQLRQMGIRGEFGTSIQYVDLSSPNYQFEGQPLNKNDPNYRASAKSWVECDQMISGIDNQEEQANIIYNQGKFLQHSRSCLPDQLQNRIGPRPTQISAMNYLSKSSITNKRSGDKIFNLQNQVSIKNILDLDNKTVTPEPKHQHIIFQQNLKNDLSNPSSEQKFRPLIASVTQSAKRNSHTIGKFENSNLKKVFGDNRIQSSESVNRKSNILQKRASNSKTTSTKNPFGQKFKEMLSLADIRKKSKEGRSYHKNINNIAQNMMSLKNVNITSQRQLDNQMLIVDTPNLNTTKRRTHTDKNLSPKIHNNDGDLTESDNDWDHTSSKGNFKLQNQNEGYKVKSRRDDNQTKIKQERDESSQRLQKFVNDNNKKLEEILKMAEKIEMRSQNLRDGSNERSFSRSHGRKLSLIQSDTIKRKAEIMTDKTSQGILLQKARSPGKPEIKLKMSKSKSNVPKNLLMKEYKNQ